MVASRRPVAPCPVCHRADQVRTMQTAYEAGEMLPAPPPMPAPQISLVRYLGVGMALVGAGVFLIFVMLATGSFSWLQTTLTLLCIVIALLLSFLGIRHANRIDEEARRRYPFWDQAMAHWTRLRFCVRDKIIFDPQSNQVLTNIEVKRLIDLDQIAQG
jgi:hypothetical protein